MFVGDVVIIASQPTALIRLAMERGCQWTQGGDMLAGQMESLLDFFGVAAVLPPPLACIADRYRQAMSHIPAERCLAIIELLADGAREMPLGEIAEGLSLPKSGVHRLLATLIERGLGGTGSGHRLLSPLDAPCGPRTAVLRGDRHSRHLAAAARQPGGGVPRVRHGWRWSMGTRSCGSRTRKARPEASCISHR